MSRGPYRLILKVEFATELSGCFSVIAVSDRMHVNRCERARWARFSNPIPLSMAPAERATIGRRGSILKVPSSLTTSWMSSGSRLKAATRYKA